MGCPDDPRLARTYRWRMARFGASLGVLGVALVFVVGAPTPAGAAGLPCQVAETNRHQVTPLNLDGDPAKETVDVFNVDGAESPLTEVMVCDAKGGELVRTTLRVIWGPSPGNRESGLREAWVGDLDRSDGRVEVAARHFVTPSVGEELVLVRQRAKHSHAFKKLQTIAGDTVTMTRSPGKSAFVTADLTATHSPDGAAHSERWTYVKSKGRWVCSKDCFGRPEYTMSACAGEVPGILDSAAVEIRVLRMSCADAKVVIKKWMKKPRSPIDGFTVESPAQFRVLGQKGSKAFFFALRGTS